MVRATILSLLLAIPASAAPWAPGPRTTTARWDFDTEQAGQFPADSFTPTDAVLPPGVAPYPTAFQLGMSWSSGQWTTTADYLSGLAFSIPGWKQPSGVEYLWVTSVYTGLPPEILDPYPTAAHAGQMITFLPSTSRANFALAVPLGTSLDSVTIDTLSTRLGDVNYDGLTNITDINLISANWKQEGYVGDANGDGTVDVFDINLVSAGWGGVVAVPEPSADKLLLVGMILFVAFVMRAIK